MLPTSWDWASVAIGNGVDCVTAVGGIPGVGTGIFRSSGTSSTRDIITNWPEILSLDVGVVGLDLR